MNIALIGYRGSGKSTIGKRLANQLWMDFVDTDALIVARAGKTIREIFAAGGEPAFRDLESAVIADVMAKDNQIIALGGGAILRPENLQRIKSAARVIYLQADAATLHARITADPATAHARPHLTLAGGTLEEVQTLLATRDPLYRAAATATLEVTRLTPEDAATHITRLI
jgi:shikimate kinase